jgi:high-affinity iron transporter
MGISLIITSRECLEMLLIIVPLLVYLSKVKRFDLAKYIYYGCTVGVMASIALSIILIGQVYKMYGYVQQLFLGLTMILLSILILYNIVWVSNQIKQQSLVITEKYEIKLTIANLFLLSFITIFRESIEIIIFLLPLATQSPLSLILGVCIGVLCSLIFAFLILKTSIKLNVYVIFNILTLILIFIGGHLLGEGLSIIFPVLDSSIKLFGQLIYTVPLLFLFLKRELRKYLRK